MNTTQLLALLFMNTALACGSHGDDGSSAEGVVPVDGPARVDAPAVSEAPPPRASDMGAAGTTSELLTALRDQTPDTPVFVVVKSGVTLPGGEVVSEAGAIAHALRLEGDATLVLEFQQGESKVALSDVTYLKTLDFVRIGQEVERVAGIAVNEIDDFDLDEAARRGAGAQNGFAAAAAADFDCIARFARISASRDFIPFPLTNCSAPQDPVGDPERIADATKAKAVAQNIFNQQVTAYQNAQAMIAQLNARLVSIRNAFIFINHDPHFKEYNVLHFKNFLHGRKSYNDRYDRAAAMLTAAAQAVQAQIAAYSQVPPPNAAIARSDANRIVARKWNCVLGQGLLNNGGRSGSNIVGVSIESVGAPFVDIQVMLDDHPPLPAKDGWGGLFGVGVTANQPTDVTRFPVASFVPVTASVGLPIVMFRFQPLDAKKTRPVGRACNLRAGIVL